MTVRLAAALASIIIVTTTTSGCSLMARTIYDAEKDETRTPPEVHEGEAPVEELTFASEDGTQLHARLARMPGATRAVLYCHGAGINVARLTELAVKMRERVRAHVLVFDYRGFGRSDGSPDEPGMESDARAALEALSKATGVPASRTVVLGHSLGGAIAIELARERPEVAGLAVADAFTSLEDMSSHLTGVGAFAWLAPDAWLSIERVGQIACPKLFLHGIKDGLIPPEQGQALYAAAREPKRLVYLDAGHNPWSRELTWSSVLDLLENVAPEPSSKERSP